MSMREAVRAALAGVTLPAADAAAVALAELYADAIDAAKDTGAAAAEHGGRASDPLATYGPKLLAVLDALRLTPKARAAAAAVKGGQHDGGSPDEPVDPLDELRRLRDTRAHRAAAVDTTTA